MLDRKVTTKDRARPNDLSSAQIIHARPFVSDYSLTHFSTLGVFSTYNVMLDSKM